MSENWEPEVRRELKRRDKVAAKKTRKNYRQKHVFGNARPTRN